MVAQVREVAPVISLRELARYCDEVLDVARFRDASVNGVQVEGRAEIRRLATAVSASRQTISEALAWGADALLVHHGVLWGDRLGPITGVLRGRLRLLLANDLNLLAYHLPLDAHPELGNNALLARSLQLDPVEPFALVSGVPIGFIAESSSPRPLARLVEQVRELTGRDPLVLPGGPAEVRRVAVLSGSGASALPEAAELGCQALLTGEARETTMALARELGVTVIAAGHEATERLGVQALGQHLAERFELETTFLHDPNPV